ncbi:MAG: hypothetical protein IJK84_02670 [Bacteroidales bacterium]|nr:hypothetical protein [Bacteroidales bacterium]
MKPRYTHISVALPVLDEQENLPLLLQHLRKQTYRQFTLYCCVNNVEGGVGYEGNQLSLALLRQVSDIPLVIIDRSSKGKGWTGKRKGVGWARKVLFDRIMEECDENELIVSLDADTSFSDNYLEAVAATMNAHPGHSAFCVPYYHPLAGDERVDRAMLRYECYMRHYLLGLLRIDNPYAFTALGSAIAFPLWAYRRVGGITPLQGGEDFYLLQKYAKTGQIVRKFVEPYHSAGMVVSPQGRPSARVPFGTGPAIVKGIIAMDESYPFYTAEGFAAVKATYNLFPALYDADLDTPMTPFLRRQLATDDLWSPLRANYKRRDLFVHACTERVDGLRILQFLKNTPAYRLPTSALPVDFLRDSVTLLDNYRHNLFLQEMSLR